MSETNANRISHQVNFVIEHLIAALMFMLVIDVGIGFVARYFIGISLNWTEELARYLLIWTALLAISSGIARREHIGLMILFKALPKSLQRYFTLFFDCCGLLFFGIMLVYGMAMSVAGASQTTMTLGFSMSLPYAAVPIASAVACIQLVFVGVRDFLRSGEGFQGISV